VVIQQRLSGFSGQGIRFALAILGVLVLCGLAGVLVTGSLAGPSTTQSSKFQAFPNGPGDRGAVDEVAVQRGANADSARYAAQVPGAKLVKPSPSAEAPTRLRGPR
jgi:hypothetical protein